MLLRNEQRNDETRRGANGLEEESRGRKRDNREGTFVEVGEGGRPTERGAGDMGFLGRAGVSDYKIVMGRRAGYSVHTHCQLAAKD